MIFEGISKDLQFKPNNTREYLDFLEQNEGKKLIADIRRLTGKRTSKQSNSVHLFCDLVAKAFNEAGYTVQLVLKEKIDLDWNKDMVKELLWRPAQKAITGKESTTDLDKVSEIDTIYEHLNRHFGEKFGIHIPFPKDEDKDKPLPEYPTMDGEITAF